MPVVFVHGVPDTQRVWAPIIDRLARTDVVALSLPGFGVSAPAGFSATKEAYVDWLVGELTQLAAPVDIVGHDWGALLVLRAAMLRPDLIRTWAAGAAPIDPEYVWHETAQLWQTPGVGEQFMELATPEQMEVGLVAAGVPQSYAAYAVRQFDVEMKRCILALYRSAIRVSHEWDPDMPRITAPGVILWGDDDPYAPPHHGERMAERLRAKFVAFPQCGHWWQLERPDEVVAELEALWQLATSR